MKGPKSLLIIFSLLLMACIGFAGFKGYQIYQSQAGSVNVAGEVSEAKLLAISSSEEVRLISAGAVVGVDASVQGKFSRLKDKLLSVSRSSTDNSVRTASSQMASDVDALTAKLTTVSQLSAIFNDISLSEAELKKGLSEFTIASARLNQALANDKKGIGSTFVNRYSLASNQLMLSVYPLLNSSISKNGLSEAMNTYTSAHEKFKSESQTLFSAVKARKVTSSKPLVDSFKKLDGVSKGLNKTIQQISSDHSKRLTIVENTASAVPFMTGVLQSLDQLSSASVVNSNDIKTIGGLCLVSIFIAAFILVLSLTSGNSEVAAERAKAMEIVNTGKNLNQELNDILANLTKLQDGDLTIHLDERNPEYAQITSSINKAIANIKEVVNEFKTTITSINTAAEQSVRTVEAVSSTRKKQEQTAEYTRNTTQEANNNVADIKSNLLELQSSASNVNNQVKEGLHAINENNDRVGQLGSSYTSIHSLVKSTIERTQTIEAATTMLREIANITSLLSVNTKIVAGSIEGEDGKKMKHTADQMEELSKKAIQASDQITEVQQSVTGAAKQTQGELENGVGVLQEVLESNKHSAKIFDNIKEASSEVESVSNRHSNHL